MNIQLQVIPPEKKVADKEIFVRGELHNAREYMEQFQENKHKSFGIDSQNNIFFAPTKKSAHTIYKLIYGIIFVLPLVAIIKGDNFTSKNGIPVIPFLAFLGLIAVTLISGQLNRHFKHKRCTTEVNATIIGKHKRKGKRRANHTGHHIIINTIFLVEYDTNIYVLCQRNDENRYGEIGDICPILIDLENPFTFCTEKYKRSSFFNCLAFLIFLCVFAFVVFFV